MAARENRLKSVLRAGGVAYSSSVRLPEPGLCEILGLAGFDFVLLDGEHGTADAATTDRLVQGCFAGGTTPIVRVLRNDEPEQVMRALDLGAQGIMIPHCRSAADAQRLREAALYPPAGRRGYGPGRCAQWGRIPTSEFFPSANAEVSLLALVEDPEALDRLDEIAAAGLDVLWIGTGDLALSFGVPGQTDHPRVLEAAEALAAACRRHGVAAGFPARNPNDIAWARDHGFRVIGYGCAEQYVMQTARGFLQAAGR